MSTVEQGAQLLEPKDTLHPSRLAHCARSAVILTMTNVCRPKEGSKLAVFQVGLDRVHA